MIPRYTLPEMQAIWSDEARMANWLEVEVAVVEARAELVEVPEADAAEIRERAAFSVERAQQLERITRHDVAAFVQCVGESSEAAARWPVRVLSSPPSARPPTPVQSST